MDAIDRRNDSEISFLAVATMLLRSRRLILFSAVIGGILTSVWATTRPSLYVATASFMPQGGDATRSSLAGLAGQLGVTLPTGNQSLSPEFYLRLLKSRVLLGPIVADSFTVPELNGTRQTFASLFKIDASTESRRSDLGVAKLSGMVNASTIRNTGIVEFELATRWPSLSVALVSEILQGVDDFNKRTRQGQASAERRFVEGRMSVASSELRTAEDRLAAFLRANRQYASSPELTFERDRLQRDVSLQQQVYSGLVQSYDDVRIREVRDTPAITMIEPPAARTIPQSRQIALAIGVGISLGGLVGVLLAALIEVTNTEGARGDKDALRLQQIGAEIARHVPRTLSGLARVNRK